MYELQRRDAVNHTYQVDSGSVLRADSGVSYEILEPLAVGAFGELYKARSISNTTDSKDSPLVVLKVPRIDEHQDLPDKFYQIGNVLTVFTFEKTMMERLRGLTCVPQLLDHGRFDLRIQRSEPAFTVLFLVEEYIEGQPLRTYLATHYSNACCEFSGLEDPGQFISWARKIAVPLIEIHQRQVVHGDIWQDNILVAPGEELKIIDFGQALFRDLTFGRDRWPVRTHPCAPPERKRSVIGDLYAVGAVLYYLATGEDVTAELRRIEDIDQSKDRITEALRRRNPKLYKSNFGVVDIICRCLRYDPRQRTPHGLSLLRDIEIMSEQEGEIAPARETAEILRELDEKGLSLFARIARVRTRELHDTIQNMIAGVYDLIGDHEEIVSGLAQYLSLLGPGDEYLTVSLPSFWLEKNLGVNGRFLTMNKLAAIRGASIRRVFVMTEAEVQEDNEARAIVESHVRALTELEELDVETRGVAGTSGYRCGVWVVSEEKREEMLKEDHHFGLLVKDGKELVVYPIYTDDRSLSSLLFRADPRVAASMRRVYLKAEAESRDLRELFSASRPGSSGVG
jgi:serine/threonine protein kinase